MMKESYKTLFKDIIHELKTYSISYYGDRLISIVIFGSVAKDLFSPTSDVDLLFILNSKSSNYHNYLEYFDNVEEMLKMSSLTIRINPIFKTKEELGLWLSYLWNTDFLILFDRGDFFKNFLLQLDRFKIDSLIIKDNYIELSS